MSATELKKEESMTAVESSQLGGTETILVAEDDAQTRRLYNAIFQQQGYKVILAQDGEEAIKKFIENKEEIQLVLLDMIMPNKGGKEASEEIRRVNPNMKVIFASGYGSDSIDKESLAGEHVDFLFKPASPDDLLRKVRSMLDE